MQTVDLGGEWTLKRAGTRERVKATVPGCVDTDLLDARLIPNPYYRDNENGLQWAGESNWTCTRSFRIREDFPDHEEILLRCEGLDTLATIRMNSQQIARTDNMFRTYELPVKDALKTGTNTIEVRFDPVTPYIRRRRSGRGWTVPVSLPGVFGQFLPSPAGKAETDHSFHGGTGNQ